MLARLVCLLALLIVPGAARAQEPWTRPDGCVAKNWSEVEGFRNWINHTPRDNSLDWAEERSRWSGRGDVWRWLDRLYLAIDGGRVVSLVDCPFTDSLYLYRYEKYDEIARFHIVGVQFYEDFLYALVMKKTGKIVAIPELPVWSPDRSRFAYAACNLLNSRAQIAVMDMAGEEPKLEGEAPLPCVSLGDCRISWESNTVVIADCQAHPGQAPGREVVRLTRQGESWMATTSNR